MPTKRGSKAPAGPPAVDLLLSSISRAGIIASIETLPEPVRGNDVPRLVDLVEAALMENPRQFWNLPPVDRKPEEALTAHLRAFLLSLEGIQPALATMPPVIGDGYAYWSQPFARAVRGMFPRATRKQHAELVVALISAAAIATALQSTTQTVVPEDVPPRRNAKTPETKRRKRNKIEAAPEEMEPVSRLVRAVCYYLYESKRDVDLNWDPPKQGELDEGDDLAASSHTATLLITVASAFGFNVEASRLRTRLRDFGKVLRAGYRHPDTRNFVEVGEHRGKRRGEWRPPVIADLGGVIVRVMLADADAQAGANQSNSDPATKD